MGPVWDENRTILGGFWGDFGPYLGQSSVTLGSPRDHFGTVLASFWCRFGVVLRPLGALFGINGPFWSHFSPFLGHFYGHIVVF